MGEETADSIALYAFNKPTFVVDTYTRRLLSRHGLIDASATYRALQQVFSDRLDADERLFNEYHALIIAVGKDYCGATARCEGCPLQELL